MVIYITKKYQFNFSPFKENYHQFIIQKLPSCMVTISFCQGTSSDIDFQSAHSKFSDFSVYFLYVDDRNKQVLIR